MPYHPRLAPLSLLALTLSVAAQADEARTALAQRLQERYPATPIERRRSTAACADGLLPPLSSFWATCACPYACSMPALSRWLTKLLRVNVYAAVARNADRTRAPMLNIDMMRVRRLSRRGCSSISRSANRRQRSRSAVTTGGDTRGRAR